jgi:2-polyprenyl-3-methyl-5-hydroxy-6-metoxy-1,4-benzoquinol methylase
MAGDFETKKNEFIDLLKSCEIFPVSAKHALDLGAGHGIQSVALATMGFKVSAVDFNEALLNELRHNGSGLSIEIINDDIRNVKLYGDKKTELVLCCGDTISHLANWHEVDAFIADIASILETGGKLLLSFRDYSVALTGDARFIPVRNDENRIFTCFLEYGEESVSVSDILFEKSTGEWTQKVSSYQKVRISESKILALLAEKKFKLITSKKMSGMIYVVAEKC